MIVGTEGPDTTEDQDQDQDQDQGEVKETPPAQGQVTDDGGGDSEDAEQQQSQQGQQKQQQQQQQQQRQQPPPPPPDQAKGKGGGGGSGAGNGTAGGGSGGGGGGSGGTKDPTADIVKSLALAEAMKPLEGPTADLYAPDKEQARKDLEAAYKKAVGDNGELRVKLDKAHERFDRAAADMLGQRLDDWLKLFDKKASIGAILISRQVAEAALEATMGTNEKARAKAQRDTKRWADAHANWSSPVEKMTAIIGEYADKIDKLNADINNDVNRNSAMLSFWLEVAPKHLQLADKPLANGQKAVDQVAAVLKNYELETKLMNGKARDDGSLYLTRNLRAARRYVLRKWIDAAKKLAEAEAAFKQSPDDAATLKKRWDELKDDAWLKEAKSKLEKSST